MRELKTPGAFKHWLYTADHGETALYHTGYLAIDRYKVLGDLLIPVEPLNTVAQLAMWATEDGRVILTQSRARRGTFFYYVTKVKGKGTNDLL